MASIPSLPFKGGFGRIGRFVVALLIAAIPQISFASHATASSATVSCGATPVQITWTTDGSVVQGGSVTLKNLTFASTPPVDFTASRMTLTISGGTPASVVLTGGAVLAGHHTATNYGNKSFNITGSAGGSFSVTVTKVESNISGTWLGCPGAGGTITGTPKFFSSTIGSGATTNSTSESTTATTAKSTSASTTSTTEKEKKKSHAKKSTSTTEAKAATDANTTDTTSATEVDGTKASASSSSPALPIGAAVLVIGVLLFGWFGRGHFLKKMLRSFWND